MQLKFLVVGALLFAAQQASTTFLSECKQGSVDWQTPLIAELYRYIPDHTDNLVLYYDWIYSRLIKHANFSSIEEVREAEPHINNYLLECVQNSSSVNLTLSSEAEIVNITLEVMKNLTGYVRTTDGNLTLWEFVNPYLSHYLRSIENGTIANLTTFNTSELISVPRITEYIIPGIVRPQAEEEEEVRPELYSEIEIPENLLIAPLMLPSISLMNVTNTSIVAPALGISQTFPWITHTYCALRHLLHPVDDETNVLNNIFATIPYIDEPVDTTVSIITNVVREHLEKSLVPLAELLSNALGDVLNGTTVFHIQGDEVLQEHFDELCNVMQFSFVRILAAIQRDLFDVFACLDTKYEFLIHANETVWNATITNSTISNSTIVDNSTSIESIELIEELIEEPILFNATVVNNSSSIQNASIANNASLVEPAVLSDWE